MSQEISTQYELLNSPITQLASLVIFPIRYALMVTGTLIAIRRCGKLYFHKPLFFTKSDGGND